MKRLMIVTVTAFAAIITAAANLRAEDMVQAVWQFSAPAVSPVGTAMNPGVGEEQSAAS
jgi:hypothetical protein